MPSVRSEFCAASAPVRPVSEIFAVTRRILGHENELFDAFFSKLVSFGDDRSEATTAEVPAHLRNEAERARAITAFGDLYKRNATAWPTRVALIRRRDTSRSDCRSARPEASACWFWIANGEDVVDLIGADESIDFRNLRLQLISITLNQTTRNDESLGLTVGFELRGFEDRVDRFLLGRVDKTTRVDDNCSASAASAVIW